MEQINPGDHFNRRHDRWGDCWVWSGPYLCSSIKEHQGERIIGYYASWSKSELWEDGSKCKKVGADDEPQKGYVLWQQGE